MKWTVNINWVVLLLSDYLGQAINKHHTDTIVAAIFRNHITTRDSIFSCYSHQNAKIQSGTLKRGCRQGDYPGLHWRRWARFNIPSEYQGCHPEDLSVSVLPSFSTLAAGSHRHDQKLMYDLIMFVHAGRIGFIFSSAGVPHEINSFHLCNCTQLLPRDMTMTIWKPPQKSVCYSLLISTIPAPLI